MHRVYLSPADWTEDAHLSGYEAKHLAQVLRIQPDQWITVFDGLGNFAEAKILSVSKQRIDLMLAFAQSQPSSIPEITLAQAIPKGKNMDWIVQKAVELGVSRIQPLVTRHTVVAPGEQKGEKWRRTALEACKQCAQFTLPTIDDPLPFQDWLRKPDFSEIKVIASLAENTKSFRETLVAHPELSSVTVLIGPEGDFSQEEAAAALAAGFIPVTLGNLVLRVETATMFCLSALRYQYI